MKPARPPAAGANERHVLVAGARLYVREIGRGRRIVVLHGGPDFDHGYLLPEMDRLAERFHLVYYDQRGRGRSGEGVAPEQVSLASEMGDLEEITRRLGLETFALLGHSWGALLAMEYATRHPDRVSHLILMNGAPASRDDLERFRRERRETAGEDLERMQAVASTDRYASGDLEADAEYYRLHFRAAFARPGLLESVIERLRAGLTPEDIRRARAIEQRLYDQTWASTDYSLIPRLRGLTMPTLVIHGERDFIPAACAAHVAEAIPGARLVVLESCGHFAYLECPEEVLAAVSDALVIPRRNDVTSG